MIRRSQFPEASWLFLLFSDPKLRHSDHRIEVLTPARIRPYPTGRFFRVGDVPGTSCQATIAPSLRDKVICPSGPRIKLALMGLKPWAKSYSPFGATNRA